jgi:hypothetical protein
MSYLCTQGDDRIIKAKLSDDIHNIFIDFIENKNEANTVEIKEALSAAMNTRIQKICLDEIERMEGRV